MKDEWKMGDGRWDSAYCHQVEEEDEDGMMVEMRGGSTITKTERKMERGMSKMGMRPRCSRNLSRWSCQRTIMARSSPSSLGWTQDETEMKMAKQPLGLLIFYPFKTFPLQQLSFKAPMALFQISRSFSWLFKDATVLFSPYKKKKTCSKCQRWKTVKSMNGLLTSLLFIWIVF